MPSDIDELRKELDIVDVISDYLNLERAGNNFRARCPFHPDRTPSFYVSPSRQIFKCFGCGVGGDAIKFVSLRENVSYTEAARLLAKKYGIRLSIKEPSEENRKVHGILEAVADFYHGKLKEDRGALEYLKGRGIEGRAVERFRLGFSPPSGELYKLLKELDALELYERTGNIVKVEEGRYRDLFRNRLVIPIRDPSGRVVGFGGRLLRGEGPKYVNSPESELFKKRELLFGFYEGREYLRELRSAVVVEGYFDVIALHQEGFRNAVATLGTSFGREHARLLSRVVDRTYLLFDGDEAGRKAVRLAVPHLLREGIEVYPVFLPEGKDPHDFILSEGRRALKELIEGSEDLFSLLKRKVESGEDRERSLKDFIYFASFLKDDIRAYTLLSELSRLTRIPLDALTARMYRGGEPQEERSKVLSFTEKVFLKGLFELKPQINLEEFNLSSTAREYAQSILREEYYQVPEEILNLKLTDPEKDFDASAQKLRIDIPPEEIGAGGVRESMRDFIKKHRGGFRPYAVRKWRGKLES